MISYAQNGEDVILARALADTEDGFYVDVGAASPTEATVTRHFYEAGWHGINIEPVAAWAAQLRAVRLRDLNLDVAAGSESGELTFYRIADDPSLSTLSEEVATRYRDKQMQVDQVTVRVMTLNEILSEVNPERIDFLKIDVEGAEADVLGGIDLVRWRPRIIVAEATEPYSFTPTYEKFEPMLLAAGYVFASTDGINRYYVPEEELQLVPLLVPANSLDDYITMREQLLIEEIGRLRGFVRQLQREGPRSESPADSPPDEEEAVALSPTATLRADGRVRGAQPRVSVSRFAVLASPQCGAGRLAVLLAAALGTTEAVADHPADVAWHRLPEAGVLRLGWPRTERLHGLLRAHDFKVLTISRHPFDVLLAILRLVQVDRTTLSWLGGDLGSEDVLVDANPLSEEFLEWALSARAERLLMISSSWYADPAVIRFRYEDLLGDPVGELARLVDVLGTREVGALSNLPSVANTADDLEQIPGSWRRYLTESVASALSARYGAMALETGYEEPGEFQLLPSASEVRRNWDELTGTL